MSLDAIEHVIYINLDARPDRRAHIEKELAVFPPEKVERLRALQHDTGPSNILKGAIGCTKSHIAVLQRAIDEGWSNYLVVEDDFMWKNYDTSLPILDRLLHEPYDVILLGGTAVRCNQSTLRLLTGQTTTAYIVSACYYAKLMETFKKGLEGLLQTGNRGLYCIDMHWKCLHAVDRWFIVVPGLCAQRPDYSDIEGRVVDYRRCFI